jgi:diguanylate cyclase (GGDEF)-like protein/PAS domain S-box-containing protein
MISAKASTSEDERAQHDEQSAAQDRLRRQLDFTRTITKSLGEGVIAVNADGRLTFMNPAAERMLGWKGGELLGRVVHDVLHQTRADGTSVSRAECAICAGIRLPQTTYSEDDVFVRRDGTTFPVAYTAAPILDGERATGAVIAFRDLTAQKLAESEKERLLIAERRARAQSEAAQSRLRTVIDVSPVPMAILDSAGLVRTWNLASERTFGWTRKEVIGVRPPELPETFLDSWSALLTEVDTRAREAQVELRGRHKNGSDLDLVVSVAPLHDVDHPGGGYVMVAADITERKRAERELEHQAMHDGLTGLPNRLLLLDRLDQAVRSALREPETFALLFMDLDRFKEVNDTYGHLTGDMLLQEVATRLRTVLRDSDTVARLGGDEFAILLRATDENGAVLTAEKLLTTLIPRVFIDDRDLPVGGSIGIALFPDHATSGLGLMQRADIAMYLAKRGRLGVSVYQNPGRGDDTQRVG